MRLIRLCSVMALVGSLAACEAVRDASDHAADSSKKVIHDAKESWRDLLTYKPREVVSKPLPQTRYCYRMQSDIVCYDTPQAGLTAPLIGYQDGAAISWHRPGGGSTGFSRAPDAVVHVVGEPSQQAMVQPTNATAPSPSPGEIAVTNKPSPFKKQVK